MLDDSAHAVLSEEQLLRDSSTQDSDVIVAVAPSQPPGQGVPACCVGTTRQPNCKVMKKEEQTN